MKQADINQLKLEIDQLEKSKASSIKIDKKLKELIQINLEQQYLVIEIADTTLSKVDERLKHLDKKLEAFNITPN